MLGFLSLRDECMESHIFRGTKDSFNLLKNDKSMSFTSNKDYSFNYIRAIGELTYYRF